LLSFAYVYFLESGLFNGLQVIQIKNLRHLKSRAKRIAFPLSLSHARHLAAARSGEQEKV
jgi:hypothetical protein